MPLLNEDTTFYKIRAILQKIRYYLCMTKQFTRIGLIATRNTTPVSQTLHGLVDFLSAKKLEIVLETKTDDLLPGNDLTTADLPNMHQHCDLLIVVGGDGSLLHVARLVVKQNLPILGINRGSLGFLTDICPDEIETRLLAILDGQYYEETRFLLSAQVNNNHCVAVNEMVLSSKTMAKMIHFDIYVDNKFMCHHKADGLMVSTPTGSTAYSLSGGGPILHPALNAIVLMPMFPHTLTSRPIVIDADADLSITVTKENKITAYISGDSDIYLAVEANQTVKIKKMKERLRLIHPIDYSYFETLRSKLHWG
ncbi:MAG: NAD(+) kinase [Pseudomonadota bacterium]